MELKIEYLNKEELKPYANNAKVHTADQVEQIKNSIREFGFNDPIGIWGENEVVEGHGRLLAVMEMDIDRIPVIRLDNLSDEQRKAYAIVHNKLAEKSDWDNDLLGEELKGLISDFDMTEFGFGEFEISILTEDFEPEPYDDELIKSYGENEDKYLAKQRVIITYSKEYEEKLAKMLNQEMITKVVYDITELLGV